MRPQWLVDKLQSACVATAVFVAPIFFNRLRLIRRLTRYCRTIPVPADLVFAVRLRRDTNPQRHLAIVSREQNRIEICCLAPMLRRHFDTFANRIHAAVGVIAMAPLEHLQFVADVSDGEASGPGRVSFCSTDPRAVLIPDDGFVRSEGYRLLREHARALVNDWTARSDQIVWRGSTTGAGVISKDRLSADDPDLLQRVRLCLALHGMPGTDVKISGIVQSGHKALDRDRLGKAGILGSFIAPVFWYGFKFAIDIDGNSNAWSNLFTRLVMGCCVLKVASPSGYRQWYYGELEPWTHFVPVKADLSDILERIAWCRANPAECERIAARGQAFAMAHDFRTEMARVIQSITAAAKAGTLETTIS